MHDWAVSPTATVRVWQWADPPGRFDYCPPPRNTEEAILSRKKVLSMPPGQQKKFVITPLVSSTSFFVYNSQRLITVKISKFAPLQWVDLSLEGSQLQ